MKRRVTEDLTSLVPWVADIRAAVVHKNTIIHSRGNSITHFDCILAHLNTLELMLRMKYFYYVEEPNHDEAQEA